jgi:hypothetical protein
MEDSMANLGRQLKIHGQMKVRIERTPALSLHAFHHLSESLPSDLDITPSTRQFIADLVPYIASQLQ